MKKIIIPPVFVLCSFISIFLFYFFMPDYNYIPFPFNLCGLFIVFLGFRFMGTSRELFKKHNTTLSITKSSHFIMEGLYLKTRNPMYIGMFLLLFGTGVCFMNLFSMLVPIVFVALIHLIFIPKEERLMAEAFGSDYLEYKKKVRRWI